MKTIDFIVAAAMSLFACSTIGNGSGGQAVLKPMNSGSAYSRLCRERDLRGLWRVVKWIPYVEVKGVDWRESLFLRHQWLEFDGNGHLKTVASNKKMKSREAKALLEKAPWGVSVSFKREGFCEISSETGKFPDSIWRCVVITRNLVMESRGFELREGDVVMTLLSDDENILYFRLMRRERSTVE